MMRHRFALLAGLFFFAGLLGFGPLGCHKAEAPHEEDPKAPVKAVAAQRLSLGEYTELLGATQALPQHSARVTAPVEGHVLWALSDGNGTAVVEGQLVEKGQVIVQLDDRIIQSTRIKTQGMLEDLQAQKRSADAAVQLAQLDRDRLEKLLPGSAKGAIPLVSKVELEKASLLYRDAVAKRDAVSAKEKSLHADLAALDVQIEYHKLRAPIAGQLGTVQAVPGQTLAIGASIAEIVDLQEIDAVCVVPPDNAARLVLGQTAWLTSNQETAPMESSPAGKIVYIAVQAQVETGNFLVKVRFPNPDLRIRANMVVRCQVRTQPEKERLTIPEAAVMEDQNEPVVVVVQDTKTEKNDEGEEETIGEAHKLRAILGVRDRQHHLVEILGLEDVEKKEKVPLEDDLLFVIEGGHGLHDGDEVRVQHEEKKDEEKKEE